MSGSPSAPGGAPNTLENRTFDEIAVGDAASATRRLSAEDVRVLAALTGFAGRDGPDPDGEAAKHLEGMIAHGMWEAR